MIDIYIYYIINSALNPGVFHWFPDLPLVQNRGKTLRPEAASQAIEAQCVLLFFRKAQGHLLEVRTKVLDVFWDDQKGKLTTGDGVDGVDG